jgi:GxxExxY protein
MTEILYKELSYLLNKIFFDTFNYSGPRQREKTYCQQIAKRLTENNIPFTEQHTLPVNTQQNRVTNRFADFLIADKIIVEIKTATRVYGKDFDQLQEYLRLSNIKLGLLVVFTATGAKSYRVLNIY